MSLDNIVTVNITRATAGVTQTGFGIPLILGPNGPGGVNAYSSLSAVAEDYDASDAEYLMAQKIFSQNPKLPLIKTGDLTLEAQVVTITPNVTVQEVFGYAVTVNGTVYTYTSDSDPTASEVVSGLIALINAGSHPVTASGTTTLIITADVPGQSFTVSLGARLTQVTTNANVGVAASINSAIEEDNDWYFLLLTDVSEFLVLDAAATIEALYKMFVFRNGDADVRTSATDDIASVLGDAAYFRTALFYSGTLGDYPDAAFVGRCAPLDNLDVNTATWANKTLSGVTVDNWTDGEVAQLENKNVNYYVQLGGLNVTQAGKVIGNEYIDIIRGIDWMRARMQEEIFGTMARSLKIPFTDAGIAVVEADVRAVLQRGVGTGLVASSQDYSVSVPKSSAISANDKAARRLTGVTFEAVLAGAIHAVQIDGTVTL